MRNKSLDAVKAIAACLVVCIHVSFPGQAGQLVKVLARCAVPFFFMVSGYFCYYQNCNASKRILSKILHIMKLFAVSVVFYFIWECFMKAWNGERVWTWIKGLVSTEHLKEFFVYNSTSPVRAHLWFLPALIYCYLLALLIEKWRMRKAAYCMAPVLLAILLWRAEFCVFFDRFYHTMEYRNFLFTGMSFFLTGQMIREYQDKIVCKRLEQWMQWGLKAGMSFGVALSMMEYAFRGAGEIYTGNCVAVICLFLWLILYGREINFSLCTGGNRKKICFPDLSSSSGSIRSSEKMFRRSGSQQLSDLFLAASGFGIYADSGDSFWHICGLCVCKAKYFAE